MTIFELYVPIQASAFKNERPFVWSFVLGEWATAPYWTEAFGAPAESVSESLFVNSFKRDGINRYNKAASYALMLATEQSFFWDSTSPATLYFHIEHDQDILSHTWQYGKTFGFSKERGLYIDDIFYSPIIDSVPSLAQSQDLEAYDEPAFIDGSVALNSANGDLDWMIDTLPMGFECALAYLKISGKSRGYTRSELNYLAALYVEDVAFKLSQTTLTLQDRRKAQNINVPTELFSTDDYPDLEDSNVDKPIPLLYGTVRYATPVLVNGSADSGDVEYRLAQVLTSLGTVQVKKTVNDEDTWVDVTPSSIDLTTGSFVLSSSSGRDDNDNPYDCRVCNPVNSIANPVDIIIDLNEHYTGAKFIDGEYDVDECNFAKAELVDIGIFIDSQAELYSIIQTIQGGSNIGFRYEFNSSGERTIRLDDWDREESFFIHREDIVSLEDIEISTDVDLLGASIKVKYAKDYTDGDDDAAYLSVVDTSKQKTVQLAYGQNPQLEFETLLQTEALASACALLKAEKYSVPRKIVSFEIMGSDLLTLRIYDVGKIELTAAHYDADNNFITDGRKWAGVWKAIILSIEPDESGETNKITAALIERVDLSTLIESGDGVYLADENGRALIAT